MKFYRSFALLLLSASLVGIVRCMPTSEPACSRFDYEEKLLAKTIRLEVTVEDLVKRVTQTETTLKNYEEKTAHLNTTCPQDYKYHSDMNLCWKFEKGAKLNYFESHERCSKQGAHLMVVYTKGVLRFMQEWLASVGAGTVYVGATDITEEGTFTWSTGENVQQFGWKSGEPSKAKGENCLVIDHAHAYQFCDRACSDKYDLLCQIEAR